LDEANRLRSDGHGAYRLLVTFVPDVQDGVPLASTHLHFVVHFGHQRANGIDHCSAGGLGRRNNRRWRTVGAEHDGRSWWYVADIVNENHSQGLEVVHDELVVDYLVIAVHRRVKDPGHPIKGLNRLFDAGTEAPGCSNDYFLHVHPHQPSNPLRPNQP